MNKIVNVFFAFILSYTAFGQQSDSATASSAYKAQLDVLNRPFLDLKEYASLSELEDRYKITLNTIGGCLMILEFAKDLSLDFLSKAALKARLEEIADNYVEEGVPMLLTGNGMNSVGNAVRKNSQQSKYNLKYISIGNSCLSEYGSLVDFGITAFNRWTLDKLGLEYAPGVEVNQSKTRQKKKKNAA